MNITEANNVNTVLKWMLTRHTPEQRRPRWANGPTYTENDAFAAAQQLADKAYKALSAGVNADDVAAAWPGTGESFACPRCGRRCDCT